MTFLTRCTRRSPFVKVPLFSKPACIPFAAVLALSGGFAHSFAMPNAVASKGGVILGRVLRPERGDLPHETARWLLDVDFDPADRKRIAELYEKAREGALSAEEDAELEDYGDVGRLLELLKAKAKTSLHRPGAAA